MAKISKEYEGLVAKTVGQTSSGKNVFLVGADDKLYKSFTRDEHRDAAMLHFELAKTFENAARYLPGNSQRIEAEKSHAEHETFATGHLEKSKKG